MGSGHNSGDASGTAIISVQSDYISISYWF